MKVRNNITLYECDFCKKRLIKEDAMKAHEPYCNSNPKNKKKCMGCAFAKREEVKYYYDHFDGEHEATSTAFRCTKFDKLMYPYKAERMGLPDNYPENFEGQVAMPVECEGYEWEHEKDVDAIIATTPKFTFNRQTNEFEPI